MGRLKCYLQLFLAAFIFISLNLFVIVNSAPGRSAITTPASKIGDDGNKCRIPIGVVFDQNTTQIQNAFKIAMMQQANNKTTGCLNFQVFVDIINTADVFKLSRLVCSQFSRGVVAILAAVHPDSFNTFHSYANTFHMPFVTPFFPEKVPTPTSGMADYAMRILPDYHKAVLGTVTYYGWKNVIYLYDSYEGMLRLQQLLSNLWPGKKPYFRIANINKINNARDVIIYLKLLEKADRWSNKYVILDCTTTIAKETLIYHVRDVTLGRRNYHYLFSGLVLDELWEPEIREYNTINITGFKVVDTSRKFVKDFMTHFKVDNMSAKGALMYDAAHILLESFQRIVKQKPHIIENLMNKTNHRYRFLNCDTQEAIPLKYGEDIADFIKRSKVEGLTGKIRFSNTGVRKDFSLIVVRNSPDAELTKIATWYDDRGFRPVKKLNGIDTAGNYDQNKTYIVASIQEPPYFTSSRPQKNTYTEDLGDIEYGGFCADLSHLIAEKLGINIQFRLAADGKYGGVNPNVIGGWDGMVGELSRKEVDMVVAPFIVTEEREAVIDFSKSFLSFNRINKKSETDKNNLLAFLRPLSKETWILLASSIVLVSVVMYIVSRFSPMEWKVVAVPDTNQALEANEANVRPIIINELNLFNSLWFTVSSIMQQRSHVSPRSISGRIVSTFWWFFAFVIVSSYTAYMASQLTVKHISSPQAPTYNRMAHCPEDMDGNYIEGATLEEEGYGHLDDTFIPQPKDYAKSVKGCEMLVSAVDPDIKDFAVGFPKGSKLRTGVNLALTTLREEGEMNRLIRKHFHKTTCEVTKEIAGGTELTLNDVEGLFYVLLIGLVLAMVVALCQFCRRRHFDVAKAKVPIKSDIHSNSRLQVNEIQETRNTTHRRRRDQERWNGGNPPGSYAGSLEEVQEVAGQCSPICPCPGTPVFNTPAASVQTGQKRRTQTTLRATTDLPTPQATQGARRRSNLNAPFNGSSPCSPMNRNMRCVGLHQEMPRLPDSEVIEFEMLELPFSCSSPCSPMNQSMGCIGLRQGKLGQRSCSVLCEADVVEFPTYFTPNSNGPEEAALRKSYAQV